ncbi:MAG: hypothetical protein RIA09_15830 [Hoeflea sp.]|jgi:hypothetical protein|uniref:hypothetical protein n=1 Tax=Hoeflea sp. TaxID=1940281 RepID=UPI0032F03C76
MRPTNFREANDVLKAPEGQEDYVVDLPVFRNAHVGTVSSLWMPTDEERKIIAEGGGVVLTAWGKTHPPVAIGAAVVDYPDAQDP